MIPQALSEVFRLVGRTRNKEFLLKLSMMEIYNEVLNDLLNPAKTNLKLREDSRKGFFVEGITEETLVSMDHALSVIAAGDAHRKVRVSFRCMQAETPLSVAAVQLLHSSLHALSCLPPDSLVGGYRAQHAWGVPVSLATCMLSASAKPWPKLPAKLSGRRVNGRSPLVLLPLQVSATAFNDGSSRSHTIIRLSIEASDRPEHHADPNAPVARTLSFLHLIDLAGSESAKVRLCCA